MYFAVLYLDTQVGRFKGQDTQGKHQEKKQSTNETYDTHNKPEKKKNYSKNFITIKNKELRLAQQDTMSGAPGSYTWATHSLFNP